MFKSKKIYVYFVSIFCVFLLVFLPGVMAPRQAHRVLNSRHNLKIARESVKWIKEHSGKWPKSLSEVMVSIRKFHDDPNLLMKLHLFEGHLHKEFISSQTGNSNEHNLLNNAGGFYYDNSTGTVRINLTYPLKSYFFIYFGEKGDEIPANW